MLENSYKLDLVGKLIGISSFIFQNWVPLFMVCFIIRKKKSSLINTVSLKLYFNYYLLKTHCPPS